MLIQLGTQLSSEAGSAAQEITDCAQRQILGRSHLRECVLIWDRRIRLTILFIAFMHNVRFIVRLTWVYVDMPCQPPVIIIRQRVVE